MNKILLIEDNELNRGMLSRRLRKRGFEVITAVDGETGITLEATRRLKAAAQTLQIPILALTAYVTSGDRETALAAGCDDFDTKPIELPRLLQKIEALLCPGPRA